MAQFRLGRPTFEDDEEDIGDESSPLYKSSSEAYQQDVARRAAPAAMVPAAPAKTTGKFTFDLYAKSGDSAPAAEPAPQKSDSFTFDLYAGQQKPAKRTEVAEESGPLARGLKSGGVDSAKETAIGATALVADTFGAKDTANKYYGKFRELKAEAEAEAKPYESFSSVMEGQASIGDFLTYWAGYSVGQAAQTVVAAVAGAAVGTVVASPGVGTVSGAIAGALERGAVQAGVKAWVAKKLEEQVAASVAKRAAQGATLAQAEKMAYEAAAKNVFRALGAASAVSAKNLAMEGAAIYGDAREEVEKKGDGEEVDLGRVWTASVLAAATDTAMDMVGLKGFAKAAGGGNIFKNIAIESFKGGLREGATEGIQTGIERWGAGKELSTAEAIRDYIDSVAAGAVGGVLFGAAKGAKRSVTKDGRKYSLDEVRSMFEQKLSNSDGRQEIFEAFQGDPRVAAALRAAGIESSDDPRFDRVMASAIARSEQLSKIEPPTPEQRAERTKERGEDVMAAFGDTASTGTGVGTGSADAVLRRDSVVPNEAAKTLEPVGAAPLPVILPEGKITPAGTVALSPEDMVSREQGFEVMPAFQVGTSTTANRFVSQQQAETFLFGPVDKTTGKRKGGYASSVPDMDFQIRQGKRSKDAGGGIFYFVEGREKAPGAPAAPANPAKPTAPAAAAGSPQKPAAPPVPAAPPAPPAPPAPATSPTSPAPPPAAGQSGEQIFKFSEDPYTAGTEAASRNFGPSTNPYAEGTPEAGKFAEGYLDTMYPQSKGGGAAKIDEAANQAATSPTSGAQPTDAQKEAGNYKKGHVSILGLNIAVENPRGSERSGTDASGKAWRQNMAHHYGYVKGSKGADKDHVDVFLGPNPNSGKVFVVDQVNPDGSFDEHKVMLGFDTAEEAKAGYLANYSPGWGGLGAISEMPVDAFKSWVKDGQKKKPLALPAQQTQTQQTSNRAEQGGKKQEAPVKESTLWRFDKVTGLWKSERKVTEDTKAQWLEQFQKDAPDDTFVVSDRKPSNAPAKKTVEQKLKDKQKAKSAELESKSAAELAQMMSDMRERKPRPLEKTYGKNPTDEQKAEHKAKMSAWESEYRKVSEAQKKALERDNAEFRKKQEEKAQGEKPAEAKPPAAAPAPKPAEDAAPSPNVQKAIDAGRMNIAGSAWVMYAPKGVKFESLSDENKVRWRDAVEESKPNMALANELAGVKPEPDAAPKQTVEQKIKSRVKAKKEEKKAKEDEPKLASEQEARERWEEDDDGKSHVAWDKLPKEVKDDVRAAVGGGYYNTPMHDETVQRVQRNERVERANQKAAENQKKNDIVLRTDNGSARGMTVTSVLKVVDALRSGWENAPSIIVVQDEIALPKEISDYLEEKNITNAKGVYWNGRVYVIARNASGIPDVILTVAHEATGHFGLRQVLGSSYSKVMNDIYKGNKAVREKADKMMADEGLTLESAVEEVLADMAEQNTRLALAGKPVPQETRTALQSIFAAIRKWLRSLGVNYVSDGDIRALVANARRYVVDGDVKAESGQAALGSVLRAEKGTFYSAMARTVAGITQEKMSGGQWLGTINGKKVAGVAAEMEWTGVEDWLNLNRDNKLTKQQVMDFIAGNKLRVNDVILTEGKSGISDEDLVTMVEDIGENPFFMSRDEMLDVVRQHFGWSRKAMGEALNKKWTLPGGSDYTELILTDPSIEPYKAQDKIHYGIVTEGKALGWLRMNVRADANGNPVLFLEEVQSQRGQDGRDSGFAPKDGGKRLAQLGEKYKSLNEKIQVINSKMADLTDSQLDEFNRLADERQKLYDEMGAVGEEQNKLFDEVVNSKVPDAPFVKDTRAWTALLLKRAIAFAQEKGIERIAWTRGEQQVDRYKLSKNLDALTIGRNEDGTFNVVGERRGSSVIDKKSISEKELGRTVGKDLARQAVEGSGEIRLVGEEMDVGGDGLRSYYDSTIASVANKEVLKPFGGKTEIMEIEETGQHIGFVIPEKMRQVVAEDGLPLFRRKDYEKQYGDLDEKTREMALAKGHYSPPTIRERLEALKPDMWRRVVQGVFDKSRAIRDVGEKEYMMARIAQGGNDGALEGLLHHGQVFNDGGALNLKKGTKGLLEILNPVGGEVDRFLLWIAANRAEQLKKEDREKFFSNEEIQRLKRINLGSMQNGKSRAAVYAETLREMNELNRSVLDVARQTGVIGDEAYKRFSSDIWYVPFYRVMEDDRSLSAVNTSTSSGLVGQYLSKKLKGSERQLNDLMQNVLMNWSHILSASMKNAAANETLQTAVKLGAVTELPAQQKGAVKTMVNGKEKFWSVEEPLLLQSLDALSAIPSNSLLIEVARSFKTALTRLVSLSPTFKINNLIRDSVQSIGTTELAPNPITNVIQGWRAYKDNRAEALIGGGLFAMGNAFDGDKTAHIKRLIKMGVDQADVLNTPEKAKAWLGKVWEKYDDISDRAENANRLALYEQLRAKGATHLEAAYAARDLQDFGNQGAWPVVRVATQVLPYFNARLQGMYKLGRGGLENPQKFGAVLGAVTAVSLLLYLTQKDDEDWKKREDWDRDNFFWIKVPGTKNAVRIPKPFEMGAFATIVERFTEQIVDGSVEGKVFGKRLLSVLHDNLAINPVPQVVRPLYDLARNKDGFTDRPIESMGMERLSPGERVNPGTSAAAVSIGKINSMFADFAEKASGGAITANNAKLSPIQYDYLIRNYLGWLGTVIQTTSDLAARPFKEGESPSMKVDDILVVGNFVKSLPSTQSRYVTSFYENAKEIAMATADYRTALMANEDAKAAKVMDSKGDLIALAKLYSKAQRMMSLNAKEMKRVQEDKTMSGEQKRMEMDRLSGVRIEIARSTEEIRIAQGRK